MRVGWAARLLVVAATCACLTQPACTAPASAQAVAVGTASYGKDHDKAGKAAKAEPSRKAEKVKAGKAGQPDLGSPRVPDVAAGGAGPVPATPVRPSGGGYGLRPTDLRPTPPAVRVARTAGDPGVGRAAAPVHVPTTAPVSRQVTAAIRADPPPLAVSDPGEPGATRVSPGVALLVAVAVLGAYLLTAVRQGPMAPTRRRRLRVARVVFATGLLAGIGMVWSRPVGFESTAVVAVMPRAVEPGSGPPAPPDVQELIASTYMPYLSGQDRSSPVRVGIPPGTTNLSISVVAGEPAAATARANAVAGLAIARGRSDVSVRLEVVSPAVDSAATERPDRWAWTAGVIALAAVLAALVSGMLPRDRAVDRGLAEGVR